VAAKESLSGSLVDKIQPGESMISRLVSILTVFDREQAVLTAAEISAQSGLPISTTYRVLNDMTQWGLLEKDARGRFRTGVRLWELALRGSRTLTLRNAALPFMEDVQYMVRQHTQLSILEGTDILYIERLSAHVGVVNITSVAGRLPARVCSPGLLLAAFASSSVQDQVIATEPPPEYCGPNLSSAELRAMLAQIRLQLYARADGWIDKAASGVSAPIRDSSGSVVAAISVIVPNDGTTPQRTIPILQTAAVGISRRLGWRPDKRAPFAGVPSPE